MKIFQQVRQNYIQQQSRIFFAIFLAIALGFWSKDFKTFDDSLSACLPNLHSAWLVDLFEKAHFLKKYLIV